MGARLVRFVADSMLGKLGRWLRALGYDTLYLRHASDLELLRIARDEGRLLLTRDIRLARTARERGLLVQGERLDAQLREVVTALGLSGGGLLSRCLECNTPLAARTRDEVRGLVPAYTLETQSEFYACPGCGKVFWPGSHADRILARLRPLIEGRPDGAL